MRFFSVALLLPLVVGEKLVIPAVESAVSQQLERFSKYTDYDGPTTVAKALLASATSALLASVTATSVASPTPGSLQERQNSGSTYWYESIAHNGIAAFNANRNTYKVYRNVKDFGAKGDGQTDDTAAINRAISDGGRCAPGSCASSSTTNAVVYFPAGTYLISSSIINYYHTNLVGNPNNLPILKATPGFAGFGVIDGAVYQPGGKLPYGGATNIFWRQVRNFVIDITSTPFSSEITGIHWPTAQATSLQNIVFRMSTTRGTKHQGIFIEEGSGGYMNDLVFYGGLNGAVFGNQQFTMRNLTFYDAVTAISQIWSWGWTYKGISVNNCTVGVDMSNGGPSALTVGSITLIDSSFTNTRIAFNVSRGANTQPPTAGSLALENVALRNVPTAIQNGQTKAVVLAGTTGSTTIAAWASGNLYNPSGPKSQSGSLTPPPRPASLVSGNKYYERSKPSYANLPSSSFSSVRAAGARGDGTTDDTTALQNILNSAAAAGRIVYIDAGTYIVTRTLLIPRGSRIVGEGYPVLMSRGSFFSNINSPQVVVQIGRPGETGNVEWSDTVISTQGAQAGAILIKWHLSSPTSSPSGMWDVHTRVGGTAGSNLSRANCPTTPSSSAINRNCIAAYMSMHIAPSAAGLYVENCWFWVADHDIDDPSLTQITIYAGRGLLVESTAGTIWLVGTGAEHHVRYQYQFSRTQNIFAGQIQSETPYYQPQPGARSPFPLNATLDDPNFDTNCPSGSDSTCAEAWGLRVSASKSVIVYGAGLYSFFNNYSTACSALGSSKQCQTGIMLYDAAVTKGLWVWNLNTVGASGMVWRDTTRLASNGFNRNVFPSTVVVFNSN